MCAHTYADTLRKALIGSHSCPLTSDAWIDVYLHRTAAIVWC